MLANYASQIYVTLIGILMLPVYLHYMGAKAYGQVGFFTMLNAWFQLLDMGLTPTLARETARYRGGALDAATLRGLVRALEGIFFSLAILAAAAFLFLSDWIASAWLFVEQLKGREVAMAVMLMGFIIPLRSISGLYRGAVNGFERHSSCFSTRSFSRFLRPASMPAKARSRQCSSTYSCSASSGDRASIDSPRSRRGTTCLFRPAHQRMTSAAALGALAVGLRAPSSAPSATRPSFNSLSISRSFFRHVRLPQFRVQRNCGRSTGASMTNPTVPSRFKRVTDAPESLGRHVIVGSSSVILPGVVLHDGVAIGALSLVKRDCEPFSIYAGNPARRIGERKRDLLRLERQFLDTLQREVGDD